VRPLVSTHLEAEKIAPRSTFKVAKKPFINKYTLLGTPSYVLRVKTKTPEEKKVESPGNFVAEKTAKKTINKQVVESKLDKQKVSNNKIAKKPISPELKPVKEFVVLCSILISNRVAETPKIAVSPVTTNVPTLPAVQISNSPEVVPSPPQSSIPKRNPLAKRISQPVLKKNNPQLHVDIS
jgi:hypothetical protein